MSTNFILKVIGLNGFSGYFFGRGKGDSVKEFRNMWKDKNVDVIWSGNRKSKGKRRDMTSASLKLNL